MPWGDQDDNVLDETSHGGTWQSEASGQLVVPQGSWQSRLEKVSEFTGGGSLSAIIKQHYDIGVGFDGSGLYFPTVNPVEYRLVPFSGVGYPTGAATELMYRTVQLSGGGLLEDRPAPQYPDGLSAAVVGANPAWFGGNGTLSFLIVGGRPPVDGLDATLTPRYLLTAGLSGSGNLTANLKQVFAVLGALTGSGALSAGLAQFQVTVAAFAGSGALSATQYELYKRLVALLGSGVLSASAAESYFRSLGLTGTGDLIALLKAIGLTTSNQGGTGTMSALIMQKYNITGPLAGSGQLGAAIRFATVAETTTQYTANATYTIPWWCTHIDLVLLGGGGGGSSGNGAIGTGHGGLAAPWTNYTLVRGVDFPWDATSFTVVRGAGGAAGTAGWFEDPGIQGGSTTVQANTGGTVWTGVGGLGAPQTGVWNQRPGQGTGNQTYNTKSYTGSANTANSAAVGNQPGGGGGGGNSGFFGFPGGAGGAGAIGKIWIRAYQVFS